MVVRSSKAPWDHGTGFVNGGRVVYVQNFRQHETGVNLRNTASRKAKSDIAFFLNQLGIPLFYLSPRSCRLRFLLLPVLFGRLLKLRLSKADVVITQTGALSQRITNLLPLVTPGARRVLFIHDVEGLRRNSVEILRKEIVFFNKFDVVIVHSENMKRALVEQGLKSRAEVIYMFDYATPYKPGSVSKAVLKCKDQITIGFAGNLTPAKSGFIYKLPELFKGRSKGRIKIHLFGPNCAYDNFRFSSIVYRGSFPPEELPEALGETLCFGLVWDGDDIDTCENSALGRYLKFNSPHKASLYIASGVPVIVWRKAAIAKYIEENRIGIAIDSLRELPEIVNKLSPDQVKSLKRNAVEFSRKLRIGYHTKRALEGALSWLGIGQK